MPVRQSKEDDMASAAMVATIFRQCSGAFDLLKLLPEDQAVRVINELRAQIHEISPFRDEPVDLIEWIPAEDVYANDYNPNSVAPPEMALLAHSILTDGYTQPIVTFPTDNGREVVDGFHRNRVGKENPVVRHRIKGYLPVVAIKASQADKSDRIAATIRHNRARGKHKVDAMSEIVIELKRRNWGNEKIAKELGMDEDEVLRLCQITGLAEMFSDQEFSEAWDVEGFVSEFEELAEDDTEGFRKPPTGGKDRIFHTFDKWECYRAGFYDTSHPTMNRDECERAYAAFLSDLPAFEDALSHVVKEWPNSCEHYLTNASMNRIAWLGQASMCYAKGVPAIFRSGYSLLTESQQREADLLALKYLNLWLTQHGLDEVSAEDAIGTQVDLY